MKDMLVGGNQMCRRVRTVSVMVLQRGLSSNCPMNQSPRAGCSVGLQNSDLWVEAARVPFLASALLSSPPAVSMQIPCCLQQSILFCTNMLQAEVGVFLMTWHVSARDSRGSIQVGCAGRFPPCPAGLVQVLPCVWCDGHVLAFSCERD